MTLDEAPERLPRHALSTRGYEEHVTCSTAQQRRPASGQILRDPRDRFLPKRHEPFLGAFTDHAHDAHVEAELYGGERDELRDTKPARV
jgi:hypothetical protein